MNIDMWIGHRDARGGKGFLKSVQHVVIAGPIVLRTRPEAQDILDRIVAIGDDVCLDRPVAECLFVRCGSGAERRAEGIYRITSTRRTASLVTLMMLPAVI